MTVSRSLILLNHRSDLTRYEQVSETEERMSGRIRDLIVASTVIGMAVLFGFYLYLHRPSADVATNETVEQFFDPAALAGSNENPAALEDVTVGEAGIQLSPEP